MYSEIWLPDLLDSEKWLSSLFSIRLNCKCNTSTEFAILAAWRFSHRAGAQRTHCLSAHTRISELIEEIFKFVLTISIKKS